MPSASSSSSSSSLYIIRASSPPGDDPIIKGGDTDEDGGGGALSSSVAELFASSFQTQGALDDLCRKYGVPEQYSAVLPAAHQRACSPPPSGSICVYEAALEAGMRVPLHGFFCEVLAHFGIAPTPSQIAPNGWRAMAGFIVLSHFAGVVPALPVFRHFFTLCGFKIKGWYYFRRKDAAGMLFKGMPHINDWKEAFFFLKSPTPWPCAVKWAELSKTSTVEPVLTKEEKIVAKLLRVHGSTVDIKTYLSESNLAAAKITGSSANPPPPTTTRATSSASAKGMDPCVYEMMKNLQAAKAAQAQPSGVKLTVKSEPGSDTPSSSKKRKLTEDAAEQGPSRHEPSTPLDRAHASFLGASPSPPGFSIQKSSKIDHDPMPRNMAQTPDGGSTADWEAARQMLQNIVTPALEQTFSAAKPSDVIASSYITALQAANHASFSLSYALDLEEKLAAREREADALRQELSQAKAELAGGTKARAEEVRNAREAAVREFRGSTEQVLRFAEHALSGYEKGMEDMKRAALRRYPYLDPEQLVVPADGGGTQ